MDVVDLDELAAEQPAASAAPRRVRSPREWLNRRLVAVAAGALALGVLSAGAVVASRDPLSVQARGMRAGPRVGWTAPDRYRPVAAVGDDRIITTDDMTIRVRRGRDGVVEWAVDRAEIGLYDAGLVRDLPGTPWVSVAPADNYGSANRVVLFDRDTGRLAAQLDLPPATKLSTDYYANPVLVAAGDGGLILAEPTEDGLGVVVTRLNSPRLDDRAWRAVLPTAAEGFPWWSPRAEKRGSYLLIGTEEEMNGAFVGALNASDGTPADWLPDGARFDVFGDVAVFGRAGTWVAVDLHSGGRLWERNREDLALSPDGVLAEIDKGTVAVGDGTLRLLSPRTGAVLWSAEAADGWSRIMRWGDVVVAYAGPDFLWGMQDSLIDPGVVGGFDLATGRELWRVDLGHPVVDDVRGEGQLVVTQSRIVEVDRGEVIVTWPEPRSALAGLDPATGRVRWSQDLGPGWVQRVGGRVIRIADTGDYEVMR